MHIMGFKKGTSGNPNGRPKGAKNRTTIEMKNWINEFLTTSADRFLSDIDSLEPKERVAIYERLMGYLLPKPNAKQEIELEQMTPESKLIKAANDNVQQLYDSRCSIYGIPPTDADKQREMEICSAFVLLSGPTSSVRSKEMAFAGIFDNPPEWLTKQTEPTTE